KDKKKTRSGSTYLVEEMIEDVAKGGFVKYLHNSSAIPRMLSGEEGRISAFLSFSQHVQFVRTGGLAYISDYQGAGGLLTDPQVITNPCLQVELFGSGNVAAAFEAFPQEHPCNDFCKAFGMTSMRPAPRTSQERS
ncbi:kinase-like protein, partial [Calocera cornea HHB12733]